MMAIPLNQVILAHRREALRLNQQITDNELAKVLSDSARDASQMAREIAELSSGVGVATRQAQLRISAELARDISDKLWEEAGNITRDGIFRMADMAVRQGIDVDRIVGMPLSYIRGYEDGLFASGRISAQQIIARRQFGYTLSERIYRNNLQTVGRLHRTIESGLVRNLSAREMAREVRGLIDPSVPGGPSYAAMRLARTEINNSHHWVHREHMSNRPWIKSVDWLLSGSHPKPDECDDIADNGPYPRDEVPDKPHPQCLCYIAPNLPDSDEFLDSLLGGEYNDWMEENSLGRISCHSPCIVNDPTGDEGFKKFDDYSKEGREWLDGMSEGIDDRDEFDSLFRYGEDSEPFNQYLRYDPDRETYIWNGHPREYWNAQEVESHIQNIQTLFEDYRTPEGVVSYRGVGVDYAQEILKGEFFEDAGFISTTLTNDVAESFAGRSSGWVLEIQVPEGTPALGRVNRDEWELLLQPNTRFQILEVDGLTNRILARVVPFPTGRNATAGDIADLLGL